MDEGIQSDFYGYSEELPMPSGTFPENWFLPKLMALKLFEPSIPFGISPSKELSDKSSNLSPFKDQIPDGKDPEN